MIPQITNRAPVTLNSWKEIASYLDRGVRTVQRWERQLGLPVHRIGKGKRSPVYATTTELNFWMTTSEAGRVERPRLKTLPELKHSDKPIEDAQRLMATVRTLAQTIAETSVRQYKQAEVLQARILQMRRRMK
jgi:hypothetical protein